MARASLFPTDSSPRQWHCCFPPSRREFPVLGIGSALLKRPSLWRPGAIARYFGVADSVDNFRPAQAHWTLMTLGVEPGQQGRRYGSLLLEHVLRHVGSSDVFLETYRESNLGFYEKHGFKLEAAFKTHAQRGPQCWTMLRHGAGASKSADQTRPDSLPCPSP